MSIQKRISLFPVLFAIVAATALSSPAQADGAKQPETNCAIVLQVLIAGGQAGEALPDALSGVAREIRSEFGARDLRLINSYFGRSSDHGNLDYRGVSNADTPESMPGSPTFLDWRATGVRSTQNAAGQPAYQLQGLRFGARIPIRAAVVQDMKGPAPVNYESIGLTIDGISVRENVPTLIGTLTQPRTDGTLFLVLTIKNAHN